MNTSSSTTPEPGATQPLLDLVQAGVWLEKWSAAPALSAQAILALGRSIVRTAEAGLEAQGLPGAEVSPEQRIVLGQQVEMAWQMTLLSLAHYRHRELAHANDLPAPSLAMVVCQEMSLVQEALNDLPVPADMMAAWWSAEAVLTRLLLDGFHPATLLECHRKSAEPWAHRALLEQKQNQRDTKIITRLRELLIAWLQVQRASAAPQPWLAKGLSPVC